MGKQREMEKNFERGELLHQEGGGNYWDVNVVLQGFLLSERIALQSRFDHALDLQ